jgi:hypothetical protein
MKPFVLRITCLLIVSFHASAQSFYKIKKKNWLQVNHEKSSTDTILYQVTDFDKKGREVGNTYYNSNGSRQSETQNIYTRRKKIMRVTRSLTDSDHIKSDTTFFGYNKFGKKVKEEFGRNSVFFTTYKYSLRGKLIHEIHHRSKEDDSDGSRIKYYWSFGGKLLKKEYFHNANSNWQFKGYLDETYRACWKRGKLQKCFLTANDPPCSLTSRSIDSTQFIYFPRSKKIQTIRKYSDSLLWQEYIFAYKNKKLTEKTLKFHESGKLVRVLTTTFHSNGRVEKITETDAQGKVKAFDLFRYEYY